MVLTLDSNSEIVAHVLSEIDLFKSFLLIEGWDLQNKPFYSCAACSELPSNLSTMELLGRNRKKLNQIENSTHSRGCSHTVFRSVLSRIFHKHFRTFLVLQFFCNNWWRIWFFANKYFGNNRSSIFFLDSYWENEHSTLLNLFYYCKKIVICPL